MNILQNYIEKFTNCIDNYKESITRPIDKRLMKKSFVIKKSQKEDKGNLFSAACQAYIEVVKRYNKDYTGYDPDPVLNFDTPYLVEAFAKQYSKVLDAGLFENQKVSGLSAKDKRFVQKYFNLELNQLRNRTLTRFAESYRNIFIIIVLIFTVIAYITAVSVYDARERSNAERALWNTVQKNNQPMVINVTSPGSSYTYGITMPCKSQNEGNIYGAGMVDVFACETFNPSYSTSDYSTKQVGLYAYSPNLKYFSSPPLAYAPFLKPEIQYTFLVGTLNNNKGLLGLQPSLPASCVNQYPNKLVLLNQKIYLTTELGLNTPFNECIWVSYDGSYNFESETIQNNDIIDLTVTDYPSYKNYYEFKKSMGSKGLSYFISLHNALAEFSKLTVDIHQN